MTDEKDALIRDLRRQLAAAQSEIRLLKRRGLLDQLREAAPRKPAAAPAPVQVSVKLGRRLGLWRSPAAVGVVGLVLLGFAVDAGVGWYQARALKAHRQARVQLENTALTSLYVELRRIVYEADDKSYRMTVSLQNNNPAVPLYVMLNPVGVYVQSGMSWQQVPSRPVDGVSWGVVKLVDDFSYDVLFTPEVANWAELIPGYMHVRIQDDMLVSQKAQPGDDVVERRTPFYVYLRPHGGAPPVFIPMPPH
jgi:hypothetical protein